MGWTRLSKCMLYEMGKYDGMQRAKKLEDERIRARGTQGGKRKKKQFLLEWQRMKLRGWLVIIPVGPLKLAGRLARCSTSSSALFSRNDRGGYSGRRESFFPAIARIFSREVEEFV